LLIGFVWILLSYMLFGFLVFFSCMHVDFVELVWSYLLCLIVVCVWWWKFGTGIKNSGLICFVWLWYVYDDETLEVIIKILVMVFILFVNDENLALVLLMLILFGSNFIVWWGHLIHRMFLLFYLRFQRIVTQKVLAMIEKIFLFSLTWCWNLSDSGLWT